MSKREEIDTGFSNELTLTRLAAKIVRENINKTPIEIGCLIVRSFHSQGLVRKVERELLETMLVEGYGYFTDDLAGKIATRAGYVAVESLIKED